MAVKKLNREVAALVEASMEGRRMEPRAPEEAAKGSALSRQAVTVRFDRGDYAALQAVARERGTTAAALLRGAAKGIIRKSEAEAKK
jgi:hypothetical protein